MNAEKNLSERLRKALKPLTEPHLNHELAIGPAVGEPPISNQPDPISLQLASLIGTRSHGIRELASPLSD